MEWSNDDDDDDVEPTDGNRDGGTNVGDLSTRPFMVPTGQRKVLFGFSLRSLDVMINKSRLWLEERSSFFTYNILHRVTVITVNDFLPVALVVDGDTSQIKGQQCMYNVLLL